jgi:hypothetical protein
MRFRRAAKKDATHDPIVSGLRAHGYSVAEHHDAPKAGHPDITVGGHGFDQMMELKTPGWEGHIKPGTREAQQRFRDTWRGRPVVVVESLDEALAAMRNRAS